MSREASLTTTAVQLYTNAVISKRVNARAELLDSSTLQKLPPHLQKTCQSWAPSMSQLQNCVSKSLLCRRGDSPPPHTPVTAIARYITAWEQLYVHATGRWEARPEGRNAKPDHLETKVWGMSGRVRILRTEQNRTRLIVRPGSNILTRQ